MDNINRFTRPVVTGTPMVQPQVSTGKAVANNTESVPFFQVLQQQLETATGASFSKHAVSRVLERQIDISEQNLERLSHGVQIAQSKGLKDALILVDQSAYIVNAAAAKVITVDGEAVKGSVYTNIDGTVIV